MGVLVAMNKDMFDLFKSGNDYMIKEYYLKWGIAVSEWLGQITDSYEIHRQIYEAVHEQDWRPMSCGGCI